ncbi:phosphoadenylyl-sulfate reductase [Waterburya agarophytonicola K14]|uniref:Adenosine 5'-phosphosulfate reductase n=1 Tax=Waterburya agarophytonicola KI4 TaxID=2874699 RepID=A0A964BQK5_9CYAN|nr:phosphoadenylyl-sulfate reductase [Waterburya agarophytonicola]MCC0177783.1 phosphoadenylyl-sulfate reductase [Waterburya agarophytonicola KI4]
MVQVAATTTQTELNFDQLQLEYETKSPRQILEFALAKFDNIAISFSGAEDVVLIDMASKITKNLQVFSIDTGRLHPETYQLFERVREHYDLELEILFPDSQQVEALVKEKGMFSFYQNNHKECCGIRKVVPLRRKLAKVEAWITGQRKDQSPDTRANIPLIQMDTAFSTEDHKIVKFNPLANWSSEQVWKYIRHFNVPYNKLHEKGFVSIGCEPCTKAVLPNQHEREGRWWWENAAEKECGFHEDNLKN